MTSPTVEELAIIITNHLDRDDPEMNPPTESDYELAQKIRERIDSGIYFDRLSAASDVHGYVRFARLLVWPGLAVLIAVVIAIGIVL
jgi:hypothetical protein